MTRAWVCLLILLTSSTCKPAEVEADFYVSVGGSDRWSGTLAASNAQKTDGPFATLERARDGRSGAEEAEGDRYRCSDPRGDLSTIQHQCFRLWRILRSVNRRLLTQPTLAKRRCSALDGKSKAGNA